MYNEHKCQRKIRPSEYEKQNRDTINWWWRLFEVMEHDYTIPPYLQKHVIKKISPDKLLDKIMSLIATEEKKTPEAYQLQRTDSSIHDVSERTSISAASIEVLLSSDSDDEEDKKDIAGELVTATAEEEMKEVEELKEIAVKKKLVMTSSEKIRQTLRQKSSKFEKIARKEAGPNNPYIKLFRGKPERVAIWREIPPLSLSEMNLNQKSEAITEAIAIDFINWIKKIGGESGTTLDVPQVMKMFEIGFNTHAATSLAARVKEMPAVTKAIADVRHLPDRAIRAKLYEKLRDDVKAFKKKKIMFAFGTALPSEMRYIPPKENSTTKWLQTKTLTHLQDMSAVWEGITHLRSTRGFCRWIMEHPDIPAPKYLEDLGMLRTSFFDKPHYSIETQESGASLGQQHISATEFLENRFK